MKMQVLAASLILFAAPVHAAPDPAKAKQCRGEMGKMVSIGLIQHAEKTSDDSMVVTLLVPQWNVLPSEMKLAVGRTIGCVLTEGEDLTQSTATIEFVGGPDKTPIAKMTGDDLTVF